MKKSQVIITILILSLVISGYSDPDQTQDFPGDYNLFKIDRSRDADVVMYDVNLDANGNLNEVFPIAVYWIKHTENGRLADITSIQKKFGYGIEINNIGDNLIDFEIVSYKNQAFQLRKTGDGVFRVFTMSGTKEIEVSSLFIKFEDDSFWFPTISRVDVQGTHAGKRSPISETITAIAQ